MNELELLRELNFLKSYKSDNSKINKLINDNLKTPLNFEFKQETGKNQIPINNKNEFKI